MDKNRISSDESLEPLRTRIAAVRARILAAAQRAGRNPEDILLLAVSKTVEPEVMKDAFDCGLREFGENRVQEYLRKKATLEQWLGTAHTQTQWLGTAHTQTQRLGTAHTQKQSLETSQTQTKPLAAKHTPGWHFIGRLQTNKVRLLAGQPLLLHALDRLELLEALCRQSRNTGCRWKALIEVNVSGEGTKAGVAVKDLEELVRAASGSGCVSVCGLMTVAPDEPDPAFTRPVFRRLCELAVDIRSWKLDNVVMNHLSMGMSHDLEVAVEEGSTIVRVGTALFGERAAQPGIEL